MPIPALLASTLLSSMPGLLGSLFGGNQNEQLKKQAMQLLSPERLQQLTQQLYQQFLSSPAFSQGQSGVAAGANQAGNQVQANLAARGIGTTGTGAVLSSLTPSLVGSQMAGLRTGGWNQAQQAAQSQIQQQLKALFEAAGMQMPSSMTQQLFGAGAGALGSWLGNRQPGGGGGGLPWQSLMGAAGQGTGALMPARR